MYSYIMIMIMITSVPIKTLVSIAKAVYKVLHACMIFVPIARLESLACTCTVHVVANMLMK